MSNLSTYRNRIERAREKMEEQGIELLFLSPTANMQYLTGIKRRKPTFGNINYPGGWLHGAFIGLRKGPVLTMPRMVADYEMKPTAEWDVRVLGDVDDPFDLLRQVLSELDIREGKVAIDDRAWAQFVVNFQRVRPDAHLVMASQILRELRMIKDDEELALMRKAGEITTQVFGEVLDHLRPGVTELDIASEIDHLLQKYGAEGSSFDTAVFAMDPAHPRDLQMRLSDRTIEPGTSLSFDFGCMYEGYCSDFGRSVFIGQPPDEYRKMYQLVIESQETAIPAMRSGHMTAEQLDDIARQVIVKGGYGEFFSHRLGHGIGLDVHESPYLDRGDGSVLRKGMTFTVEPSIMIPRGYAARIEDVVVVGEEGGEQLTHFTKELRIIDL